MVTINESINQDDQRSEFLFSDNSSLIIHKNNDYITYHHQDGKIHRKLLKQSFQNQYNLIEKLFKSINLYNRLGFNNNLCIVDQFLEISEQKQKFEQVLLKSIVKKLRWIDEDKQYKVDYQSEIYQNNKIIKIPENIRFKNIDNTSEITINPNRQNTLVIKQLHYVSNKKVEYTTDYKMNKKVVLHYAHIWIEQEFLLLDFPIIYNNIIQYAVKKLKQLRKNCLKATKENKNEVIEIIGAKNQDNICLKHIKNLNSIKIKENDCLILENNEIIIDIQNQQKGQKYQNTNWENDNISPDIDFLGQSKISSIKKQYDGKTLSLIQIIEENSNNNIYLTNIKDKSLLLYGNSDSNLLELYKTNIKQYIDDQNIKYSQLFNDNIVFNIKTPPMSLKNIQPLLSNNKTDDISEIINLKSLINIIDKMKQMKISKHNNTNNNYKKTIISEFIESKTSLIPELGTFVQQTNDHCKLQFNDRTILTIYPSDEIKILNNQGEEIEFNNYISGQEDQIQTAREFKEYAKTLQDEAQIFRENEAKKIGFVEENILNTKKLLIEIGNINICDYNNKQNDEIVIDDYIYKNNSILFDIKNLLND